MARSVEDIEQAIIELPKDQLMRFCVWYEAFDADAWDEQMEKDAVTGRPGCPRGIGPFGP
jgi:hypothetical protein